MNYNIEQLFLRQDHISCDTNHHIQHFPGATFQLKAAQSRANPEYKLWSAEYPADLSVDDLPYWEVYTGF